MAVRWKEEDLIKAIEEVQDRQSLVRKAAEKYGIPKSTLYDYLTNKVEIGARPGPDPVLGKGIEAQLVEWVINEQNWIRPNTCTSLRNC